MTPLQAYVGSARIRDCRILVLDDEEEGRRTLERILSRAGFRQVHSSGDSTRIGHLYARIEPDLLVLDLHMPGLDGFGVLAALRGIVGPGEYFPVLVVTGDDEPRARRRALAEGARDFLTKPFELYEVVLRIRNLLETRRLHRELRRHASALEETVEQRTRELARSRREILHRLARAAEFRDDATGRHAERVGIISGRLAQRVGLPVEEAELIRLAAPLHDIGKIGIPDSILLKPGPLTDDEFALMKGHTRIGAQILGGSDNRLLRVAGEIAISHHERWDGTGYEGLRGEEIPIAGRIVAVADVFDSLGHARPYKMAASRERVLEELEDERGRHFDPAVLDAFLEMCRDGGIDGVDAEADAVSRRLRVGAARPPGLRRSARRAGGTRS